jgi:hypothetical protein
MRPNGPLEANGFKSTMTTKDPKKLYKQPPTDAQETQRLVTESGRKAVLLPGEAILPKMM